MSSQAPKFSLGDFLFFRRVRHEEFRIGLNVKAPKTSLATVVFAGVEADDDDEPEDGQRYPRRWPKKSRMTNR